MPWYYWIGAIFVAYIVWDNVCWRLNDFQKQRRALCMEVKALRDQVDTMSADVEDLQVRYGTPPWLKVGASTEARESLTD